MEELDLKQLAEILWRKKIIVLFIILLFVIVGIIYTFNFVKPMYKSTSTIILGRVIYSNNDSQEFSTYQSSERISQSDLTLNSSLIETYSELVKSKSLIHEVGKSLNEKIDEKEIMKSVSVRRVNNSDLLDVTATNSNPKIARDIVKSVVQIFSENVKEIYNISNVYVIDDAKIENTPYNINHIKDVLIFFLIGLFISAGYIFLYYIIDNTIKSSYDIETFLKSRILITIPFDKKNKKDELITLKDSKSIISETFRTLRTNVQFSNINSKASKTLLVTSCLPEEGKSYISANLGITFAQAGKKVIIVDSDMRRGRQANIFNIPNENGLSNYISNLDNNGMELNWSLGKYIKETSISNLNIITAGNIPPNPSELLESEKVPELIEELKKYYDIVIFDGAPILPITDSLILSRLLTNTMLIAVYNKTKKDNLLKAKNSLENVGGKVIGVVLNKTTENSSEYLGNYYYYGEKEEKNFFKKIINTLTNNRKKRNFTNNIKRLFKFKKNKKVKEVKKLISGEESLDSKKDLEIATNKQIDNSINYNKKKNLTEEKRVKLEEKNLKKEIDKKNREEKRQKKEEEKKIALAEKAKLEAELKVERAKEEAIIAEEKEKRKEEERIKREEEKKKKAEELELKKKEQEIKNKEKAENNKLKKEEKHKKRKQKQEELSNKFNKLKTDFLIKKDTIEEEIKIKREEFLKKQDENKVKKAQEKKIKKEQKEIRSQEIEKVRDQERIKRQEERNRQLKEKEERDAELARISEEEKKIKNDKRLKKQEELETIREQEKIKRQENRIKKEEERVKKEAEKLKKEEELKKQKDEEKKRREEEKMKLQEIKTSKELEIEKKKKDEKQKREQEKIRKQKESKFTDEYIEENLYPKTKFNKL